METWLIILIVSIGLILLAGLGIGLYFLFRPKTTSGGNSGGNDRGGNSGGGGNGNGGGSNQPSDFCSTLLNEIRNPPADSPQMMNLTIDEFNGHVNTALKYCNNPDLCNFDSLSALWVYYLVVNGSYGSDEGKGGVGEFVTIEQSDTIDGIWSSNTISAALNALKIRPKNQSVINSALDSFWDPSKYTFNGTDMETTIDNYLATPGKFDSSIRVCDSETLVPKLSSFENLPRQRRTYNRNFRGYR